MYKLIGAEEILAKGVSSLAQLRPVLTQHTDPMAANATLRKDEWEQIDTRVNDVLSERQTIVDDLRGRGLVMPTSLGTILRVTERLSDMDEAEVTFDGDTAPQKDRPNFSRDVIPVPVISKDFTINWRQLEASRKRGDALDTTAAAAAARKVNQKLQRLITLGYGGGPGTNPASAQGTEIPGLTTAPNRIQVSLSSAWTDSGSDVIGDTLRMLEAAYAQNLFGPFMMYVPKNYWAHLQDDYNPEKLSTTFIQRIEAFEDIQGVRPLDTLPDNEVILLQMTEDVIDLTEAQGVTTVQWEKNPFVQNFRVITVAGPHIKSIESQSGDTINGIVHLA